MDMDMGLDRMEYADHNLRWTMSLFFLYTTLSKVIIWEFIRFVVSQVQRRE